ncbi:PAS domain S-box protein [Massilia arenosa]|uniref:histidine kinase n=1 Tax=Zemynaea arenosa TaxID=2561931 RepID=A0A4Y9S0S8_9BURK|nr:PAS domain-containing protein [Massilia arenosa]TFW13585.1 PAS domain S-box protein [Massilia arenosa]
MAPPHDPSSQEQAVEQLCVFRAAASLLASTLDLNQTLANTIAACLPALGDFGFFDVVLDKGVRRTVRAHADDQAEAILCGTQWIRSERTDINLCALSTNASAYHPHIDDAWYCHAAASEGHLEGMRALAFGSMISVPVRFHGELLGALTLFMAKSGRHHTRADLAFAEQIADLAAPIVFNVRLLDRQRRAEDALRISEERLRLATDAGRIGIWEWEPDTGTVSWSDQLYELHGMQPREAGPSVELFLATVHPDDRARVAADMQADLGKPGGEIRARFRIQRRDGAVRWLSTHAQVHHTGTLRVIGATIDITDQMSTQSHLEVLNEELQQRVQSSDSERDRIWRLSQDMFAIASYNGVLRALNPAVTPILGWTEPELLGRPFLEFVHPDQHAEVADKLAALARGTAVERFEMRTRHKDGSWRWLSVTATGENGLLYASGHDVTEMRRLREQQLSASETRLQLALTTGRMGAWDWDLAANRIKWLPGMAVLHGLPPGASVADFDDYLRMVHPDDVAAIQKQLSEGRARGAGYTIEYRVIWPDDSIHWLEGRADFVTDSAGQHVGLVGVCVDITQRKRTEQDLRFVADVSTELAIIVDHQRTLDKLAHLAVPSFADWCAVDLLDDDGDLDRVAVAHVDAAKIPLGYEIAARWPVDREQPGGAWDVIQSGEPRYTQYITPELLDTAVRDPDRRKALLAMGLRSYIGVPLRARGHTFGAITFVTAEGRRIYTLEDVRLAEEIGRRAAVAIDNAALYRSLKNADKRKDEFLAMLAHELRNPLAPIRAAAELMKMSRDPAIIERTSTVVARQVDHMTGLVDDLLDVSRVTRGLVLLEKKPVPVGRVVAAAVEQVRPLMEARNHHLVLAHTHDPVLVEGDEKRLTQVLANLLNNAAKYTLPGGHIELQVEAGEHQVAICVKDNGIGMDQNLVATAFELFAQAERSADRSQGGLGIGLALVKSLVELHGGRVKAHSAGLGQGSEFTVRLPRLAQLHAPHADAAGAYDTRVPARGQRVLIVDDNVDAAEILGLFLGEAGHAVTVCHASLEALGMVAEDAFDACILDIGLPEIDGNELARRIRTQCLRAPLLIAVTGYGQERDRANATAAGFDHYLVKPVDMGQLLGILDRS